MPADIADPSLILAQAIGRWEELHQLGDTGGPVSRHFIESLQLPGININQMYIDDQY